MTKRDFFRVIIRLFSLYLLLLTIFNFIPTNVSYLFFEPSVWPILIIIGSALFMIMLFLFLLKKTDTVIDVLKLDKAFDDERIEFGNLGSEEIVKVALIFIGGFLLLDHLPEFLHYCYLGFKKEVSATGLSPLESTGLTGYWDYFRWFVAGINLIIGYLLLSNLSRVANFLMKLRQHNK
ncbi:hypothetical protein [Croceitalea vernalis]|uniref:Uncharacterized protein n=1 Tax=Croceitalea vernalis TaxID=3075599 RepID=A0ABU3BFD8_9FLAO|nr:hypothetical protein [Croceitalea sp. P007]MDT0620860.1 hypothetical protein [Croceitalea sp. P007]